MVNETYRDRDPERFIKRSSGVIREQFSNPNVKKSTKKSHVKGTSSKEHNKNSKRQLGSNLINAIQSTSAHLKDLAHQIDNEIEKLKRQRDLFTYDKRVKMKKNVAIQNNMTWDQNFNMNKFNDDDIDNIEFTIEKFSSQHKFVCTSPRYARDEQTSCRPRMRTIGMQKNTSHIKKTATGAAATAGGDSKMDYKHEKSFDGNPKLNLTQNSTFPLYYCFNYDTGGDCQNSLNTYHHNPNTHSSNNCHKYCQRYNMTSNCNGIVCNQKTYVESGVTPCREYNYCCDEFYYNYSRNNSHANSPANSYGCGCCNCNRPRSRQHIRRGSDLNTEEFYHRKSEQSPHKKTKSPHTMEKRTDRRRETTKVRDQSTQKDKQKRGESKNNDTRQSGWSAYNESSATSLQKGTTKSGEKLLKITLKKRERHRKSHDIESREYSLETLRALKALRIEKYKPAKASKLRNDDTSEYHEKNSHRNGRKESEKYESNIMNLSDAEEDKGKSYKQYIHKYEEQPQQSEAKQSYLNDKIFAQQLEPIEKLDKSGYTQKPTHKNIEEPSIEVKKEQPASHEDAAYHEDAALDEKHENIPFSSLHDTHNYSPSMQKLQLTNQQHYMDSTHDSDIKQMQRKQVAEQITQRSPPPTNMQSPISSKLQQAAMLFPQELTQRSPPPTTNIQSPFGSGLQRVADKYNMASQHLPEPQMRSPFHITTLPRSNELEGQSVNNGMHVRNDLQANDVEPEYSRYKTTLREAAQSPLAYNGNRLTPKPDNYNTQSRSSQQHRFSYDTNGLSFAPVRDKRQKYALQNEISPSRPIPLPQYIPEPPPQSYVNDSFQAIPMQNRLSPYSNNVPYSGHAIEPEYAMQPATYNTRPEPLLQYAEQTHEQGTIYQWGNNLHLNIRRGSEQCYKDSKQDKYTEEKCQQIETSVPIVDNRYSVKDYINNIDIKSPTSPPKTLAALSSCESLHTCISNKVEDDLCACNKKVSFEIHEIPEFTGCPCMLETYINLLSVCNNRQSVARRQ